MRTVSLLLAAAFCLLLLAAPAAADGLDDVVALLNAPAASAPAAAECACGDNCRCASAELLELRAYRDRMKDYLTRYAGHKLPPRVAAAPARSAQPISYAETVCVDAAGNLVPAASCANGQCAVRQPSYTGGYYTAWMPQAADPQPVCSGGSCQMNQTQRAAGPFRGWFRGGARSCCN